MTRYLVDLNARTWQPCQRVPLSGTIPGVAKVVPLGAPQAMPAPVAGHRRPPQPFTPRPADGSEKLSYLPSEALDQPQQPSLFADSIDVRKIRFATLRDHPKEAKDIFDLLFKGFRQFNPIADTFGQIYANPRIQPPAKYFSRVRQTILLYESTDAVNSTDGILPDQLARRREPSEAAKKWLDEDYFVNVYNHLFDVDLDDAIKHDKSWKMYRHTALALGLAGWGLTLIPPAAAAASVYATGQGAIPDVSQITGNPLLASLLVLLGVTTVNSGSGFGRSPLGQMVRLVSWVGAGFGKLTSNKWSGAISAVGEWLNRDQTNYFNARHLSGLGTTKKYLGVIFKHGRSGLFWEFYKDYPQKYKAYRAAENLSELIKKSLNNTGIGFLKAVGNFIPGAIKYLPATKGQLWGGAAEFAWLMPLSLAVHWASSPSPDLGTLATVAGSTLLLAGAATVAKARFDKVKKDNVAEALTYDNINSFMVVLFSFLSGHYEVFQNPWAYSGGLAAAFLATVGIGQLIRNQGPKVEKVEIPAIPIAA